MSDLLTSLDVVNQAFKKTMRGYDPAEVDEFLDRVAESIQTYVQASKDTERTIEEQAERLQDFENIKSSLHETLLMAQRTAEEKVANATRSADERIAQARATADGILADARAKAERMLKDAEADLVSSGNELKQLQELRDRAFSQLRAFLGEFGVVLDRAEASGRLELPEMTLGLMRAAKTRRAPEPDIPEVPVEETSAESEAKKQGISEALNVLGVDPDLLKVDTGTA